MDCALIASLTTAETKVAMMGLSSCLLEEINPENDAPARTVRDGGRSRSLADEADNTVDGENGDDDVARRETAAAERVRESGRTYSH